MALTLDEQVASLRPGDHVCLLYASLDEQMTAVAPYVRHGLERNELCIFAGDSVARSALCLRLSAFGIDVNAELASTRLRLLDPQAVYLPDGAFSPEPTLAMLRAVLEEARAAGYAGVRTAGDMSWALGGAPGTERLIEYERRISELLAGGDFIGLCQYHRGRFPSGVVREVLCTHPVAVLGDKVCSNPFFEPQELADGDDSRRVAWMIDQLERGRGVELGLEAANRELETLAYATSHDLKEPARMVRLHLDLLARRFAALDGDPRRWLDAARSSASRLIELLDGLLETSAATVAPRADDVALDAVAARVLRDLEPEIAEAGATIAVGGLPTVRGDRELLTRLLRHLIGNAVKFRRGRPSITVGATTTDDRHLLVVGDDGIGIPQPSLPRVFGLFTRLHSRDAYPGHGVGLAICRRIVEAHHGRIWVESEEGVGSRFFVELPRSASSDAGQPAAAS